MFKSVQDNQQMLLPEQEEEEYAAAGHEDMDEDERNRLVKQKFNKENFILIKFLFLRNVERKSHY